MTVLLSPMTRLLGWSFGREVEESGYEWQNRPTYYINYVQGLTGSPFQFWLDLEVSTISAKILNFNLSTQFHERVMNLVKMKTETPLILQLRM